MQVNQSEKDSSRQKSQPGSSSSNAPSSNLLNSSHPKTSFGHGHTKFSNPHRRTQIIISILIVILSTLWVQISVQRYGPFVRTAQCYFNELVFLHDSQDIYEGTDVIYWRNGQTYNFTDMQGIFKRLSQTLNGLPTDSLFTVLPPSIKQQNDPSVQLLTIYEYDIPQSFHEFKTFNSTIQGMDNIFQQTLYNRVFYEHLWKIQLAIVVPIVYRGQNVIMQLDFTAQIYSSMLMQYQMQVNVLDQDLDLLKQPNPYSENNLGVRKQNDPYNMQLAIPYINWIVLVLYVAIFLFELRYVLQKGKYVNEKIKKRIKEQNQLEQLLQKIDQRQVRSNSFSSSSSFLVVRKSSQQNNTQQQKYSMPVFKKLQKIGFYYILEMLVSLFALFGYFDNYNGLICFFSWFKMILYLSQTKNRLMFGFLFESTIPTYLRIYLNIILFITAFVLFNMLVLTVTKKFQTIELGYFQYFFNYFQYGIYQNFIFAFSPYGTLAQFFYFVQIMLLLYIGNNILISVLANQVSKNSYLSSVQDMIDDLNVQCPYCGTDFQDSRQSIKKNNQKQGKQMMVSKLVRDLQLQKMRSEVSRGDSSEYNITIKSPMLSPFFPIKNQKKISQQEFLSPKLKNGNFQKHINAINRKMQNEEINSSSKLVAIEELKSKLQVNRKIHIELSDSKLQNQTESKYHKKLRSKIQLLFKKISKFQEIHKQSSNRLRTPNVKQKQALTRREVMSGLLQKIISLRAIVEQRMHQ